MGPWFWHRLPSCTCSRWHLRVPSYHLQKRQHYKYYPAAHWGNPGASNSVQVDYFFLWFGGFNPRWTCKTWPTYTNMTFSANLLHHFARHLWLSARTKKCMRTPCFTPMDLLVFDGLNPQMILNPSFLPVNPNTLAQRRPHVTMLWVWSLGRNPKKSGKMTSFHIIYPLAREFRYAVSNVLVITK